MSNLRDIFGDLVRHQVARKDTSDYMVKHPGITWLYAANGVWKRGTSATISLQGLACPLEYDVPGLINLTPYFFWPAWKYRLPGELLMPLLRDAQRAGTDGPDGFGLVRPIEKQYFFVERDGVRVVAPRGQDGTATSLRYPMPASGTMLLDLHSHHAMRAYFSLTDDRDDQGLSVSAVIGNIYIQPEIVVRLNIYGLHCPVPASMVFDSLGPFVDRYAGGSRDDQS